MVVTMKGSPNSPHRPVNIRYDDLLRSSEIAQNLRTQMVFDPSRGGWVQPGEDQRAGQERKMPPHWESPPTSSPPVPRGRVTPAQLSNMPLAQRPQRTKHFEDRHVGSWKLDLQREQELGLAPPNWSTSSSMNDARPNGKALFDARFSGNAMGRAAGGYSMIADARGMEFTAGKLEAAQNMDSNFFASDMADETAAAEQSAMANKFGNNTNLSSFGSADLALSQMSQLQRRQMDADGDGTLSAAELSAHGFDTDLR